MTATAIGPPPAAARRSPAPDEPCRISRSTVAGVGDRKDYRFAVKAQGDVGDQSGVEDLVEHRAIAHLAIAEPVHAGPFSHRQQVCHRYDRHSAREVV